MKINGQDILGIYIFNTSANYSSGDFVIYNRSLYRCKCSKPSEEVTNYLPTNPIYFSTYPDNYITVDEYTENKDNLSEEQKNKYVTSGVLAELLQDHFYYGIKDGKVAKIDKSFFENNPIADDLEDTVLEITVLDKIAKNFNTSIFELDYSVIEEIVSEYPELSVFKEGFYKGDICYLLQIALEGGIKIQQIMNASSGFQIVRASDKDGNMENWKSSSYGPGVWKTLDSVSKALEGKLSAIVAAEKSTKSTFCFKEYPITTPSTGEKIPKSSLDFTTKSTIVNILLQEELGNGIKKNYSLCVDLNEVWNSNDSIKYYINNTSSLTCSRETTSELINLNSESGIKIINIYYRSYE